MRSYHQDDVYFYVSFSNSHFLFNRVAISSICKNDFSIDYYKLISIFSSCQSLLKYNIKENFFIISFY